MLRQLRQRIIHDIWNKYRDTSFEMRQINNVLQQRDIHTNLLDHFALIDLPSPITGIPTLKQIFTSIGYYQRGAGYLPEKQNDFIWLAESGCEDQLATETLPQVVLADFRLEELPQPISVIIEKYAHQAKPAPLDAISQLAQKAARGDEVALENCCHLVLSYLDGRDWPLPTLREYYQVKEFNELLAWVLVFGRRPNHFTLSIHLLPHFSSLKDFHTYIETHAALTLNQEGGFIKGGPKVGIEQGSTNGIVQTIALADGHIEAPTGFVEFVWRYAHTKPQKEALLWQDYFTDFISTHADKVIESLCAE